MRLSIDSTQSLSLSKPLVVGVFEDARTIDPLIMKGLTAGQKQYIKIFEKSVRGETGEVKTAALPEGGPLLLLLGSGKKSEWTTRKYIQFIRRAIYTLKLEKISDAALIVNDYLAPKDETVTHLAQITAENIHLANFSFTKYKAVPPTGWPVIMKPQ